MKRPCTAILYCLRSSSKCDPVQRWHVNRVSRNIAAVAGGVVRRAPALINGNRRVSRATARSWWTMRLACTVEGAWTTCSLRNATATRLLALCSGAAGDQRHGVNHFTYSFMAHSEESIRVYNSHPQPLVSLLDLNSTLLTPNLVMFLPHRKPLISLSNFPGEIICFFLYFVFKPLTLK